ncbi:uncharacterized protein FIBRA_08218 [Fibroporia radiculosa]|uniref:Uncharacterized protein n=1 Tax=Fibroporia radiculosa TaxID=599839 RepID=J4I2D7_9APHY|nr:uncharacterized protein FIBRA_08218 [Fibroporia radiculosa]CCM05977.1 predicted protein [Fibroporia radiculosa]
MPVARRMLWWRHPRDLHAEHDAGGPVFDDLVPVCGLSLEELDGDLDEDYRCALCILLLLVIMVYMDDTGLDRQSHARSKIDLARTALSIFCEL